MTQPRRRLKRDLARLAGVAAFFVAAAWLLKQDYVRGQVFNIAHIRAQFKDGDLVDELCFVAAAALVNALGVPRLWICAVSGTLFGAAKGSVVGLSASLMGATANFYMGRYLLRGPIKRHLPDRLRKWYKLFNKNGFRALLYIRLFPFTNATLTNLISGASKIAYWDFLAATLIGFLPFTIAFATLGSSAGKQNTLQFICGTGLFALVIGAQWIYTRVTKPGESEAVEGSDSVTESATEIREAIK